MSLYIVTLTIGPILGSFITEPAAMTVTAFIILKSFYQSHSSQRLKYATIALLFVNVSIGGTLTHFAAPPVLMVSKAWSWDTPFMFKHFGYKALVAILLSTFFYAALLKNELLKPIDKNLRKFSYRWSFKGPVLVSLFLSGLIILGSMQAWWLKALLVNLSEHLLFIGAAGLTSITDNASLTYLGTLVDLSASAKYALVAGAVSGGGLTVIANAPNPVGFGILRGSFGPEGINPIQLFLWAIIPTIIALACFFLLPNL
jgi:predicted cation transporter